MLVAIGFLVLAGYSLARSNSSWDTDVRPLAPNAKQRQLLNCYVNEHNRGDCGFQGITERGCRSRGCCYEHSDTPGVPFCFYSTGALYEKCLPSEDDTDCGWDGISAETCRDQGCCYEVRDGNDNATCFRPLAVTVGIGLEVPTKCVIPSANRIDCGFKGITPGQCMQKGCCYFHSSRHHPVCYYAVGQAPPELLAATDTCAEIDEERIDCGYPGVTLDKCLKRGCCFTRPQTPGVPFCFYKKGMAPAGAAKGLANEHCVMSDLDRVDCGFQGVTPEECRNKGCCYFHSHMAGSPYCYFQKGQVPPHAQSNSPECVVEDDDKIGCDVLEVDITLAQCQAKGCCYHRSTNSSVPTCFSKEILPQCQLDEGDRQDCGFRGISPMECRDRGCCYAHSSTAGAPLCFYKAATARRTTTASRTTTLSTTTAPTVAAVNEAVVTATTKADAFHTTQLPSTSKLVSSEANEQESKADCVMSNDPRGAHHVRGSCKETSSDTQGGSRRKLLAVVSALVACCLCLVFFREQSRQAREGTQNGEESVPLKSMHAPEKSRVHRLIPGSPTYEDYEKHFMQKWDTQSWPTSGGRSVPFPKISGIYEINAEDRTAAFKAKQREIDTAPGPKCGWCSGNQKTHFHGARMRCDFQGITCADPNCVTCRIVESGSFACSAVGGEIHFRAGSHAAKGQGLAPGKTPPPESLDHFVDQGAGNAVFIANVLQGTPQIVSGRTQGPLPEGMHSRIADKDASNGVDEVIIFDEVQALPKALITF